MADPRSLFGGNGFFDAGSGGGILTGESQEVVFGGVRCSGPSFESEGALCGRGWDLALLNPLNLLVVQLEPLHS